MVLLAGAAGTTWVTLVRRRNLCEGRGGLAVRLPGRGPARPSHRRVRLGSRRHHGGPPVLRCRAQIHGTPSEVVTDRAHALRHVIEELLPAAFHTTERYANNRFECDHGRLKARLRPMRGLKTDPTARVIIRGHAFMQNLRRGHYELGVEARKSSSPGGGGVRRTRRSHLMKCRNTRVVPHPEHCQRNSALMSDPMKVRDRACPSRRRLPGGPLGLRLG